MTTSVEDVSKLELAAQIVMAPPDQVTIQDRKDAEALFMQLREGALSVETCRQILESTQNQFFMFELARALVARMLKEWSKFTIEDVRTIIAYLLNFPVNHSNLPNFVSTEMFHSAAKIIKRSSLAMPDIFPGLIAILESLLSNENPQLQAYGLQTIELISTEFLSAWRSSNISISWDFHLRAKKQFEDILLKQLMQLSLRTLSNLMNTSDLSSQLDQQICDKFLRVASLIFCWNFSPKYLYLHFKILISALRSNTFRPPESWHDIFRDTTIITFFMELHSRVRYNEQLCQNSMLCLTQLSSLMGDALGPSGPIVLILPQVGDISERRLATSMGGGEVAMEKGAGDKKVLHDQYVQLFSHHLIELFSNYVLDYEMAPLSLVIYKLITCHPMAIFERFPQELLTKFIDFIVANILRLTQPAMDLALKNDQTYHEPLTNLFQVWRTILRSAHMFNEEIGKMIGERNTAIIDAFIKSVLSPPFGTRTKPSNEEIFEESEEDEDDRTVFMDVLCDVGYFSLNSIDYFVEYISKSMVQRLGELHSVNLETINQEHLQIWQEDFHWLLLLTGYFIRQPAYSNIGNFPEELAIRCLNGFKEGEFTRLEDFEPLFTQCINNPPFDPSTYPHKLDPITLISTQILSWFSMEHQMLALLDPNAPLLSPALCQTSLWQFSLLMIVLTPNSPNDSIVGGNPHEEEVEEEDDKLAQQWKDIKHLPSISPKSQLSAKIIQMALEKLFTILSKMSGEKRLCTDVIELLINFAEYRSEELATNDHLYLLLSKLPIENLPIRRQFVKSLVVIGSSVESNEVRERMNELILQPLRTRFLQLCQNHQSGGQTTESQLADYFECFTGVADAGQADNAPILFKFLEPIFDYCVPLIRSKSSFQLLIVSILDFIKSTTDVLFFYVESRTETMAYYNLLLAIINAYKETQLQRFVTFSSGDEEEEQQTQDLATLIEILCLSISKTYLPIGESGNNALESAKVSLHGLETLLPLMSEDLLKVPQLCTSFFRLLIFISDIAPGALIQVSEQMLNGVFGCVQMALDNVFGIERVRSALEIVTNLSTFCLTEIQKGKSSLDNFMARNVLKLIPKIFELAMHFSCEMDIFNEATGALFSILQLDSDTFRAYVGQLLSFPANQDTKPQLEQAFTKLLTFSEEEFAKQRTYTASRKRNFQNKFQEFLVEVSGSLCLN